MDSSGISSATPSAKPGFKDRLLTFRPVGVKVLEGGITAPGSFRASGVSAGIKKQGLDMALIYSEVEAATAGVFTENKVCAAPVTVSRSRIGSRPYGRAIIVNAGNANACTGRQGMSDAEAMCGAAEKALGLDGGACFVASTGVIGQPMPMDRVLSGAAAACRDLSADGGGAAARAIMTTDTVPKEIALEVPLAAGTVRIGGMAKGSGMIHPDMATLLGFLTTDAEIEPSALKGLLKEAADESFNMITVDGDTSTNDSLFIMANGASGVKVMPGGSDWDIFAGALKYAAKYLAITMAGDGEGASKLFQVSVKGAPDFVSAKAVAMSVAKSSLVKTAVYGEDANWGRIICAAGYAGVPIDPLKIDIAIGGIAVCKSGAAVPFDEDEAKAVLREDWVKAVIDLGEGEGEATVWTCDFTYGYVKVNASYRS